MCEQWLLFNLVRFVFVHFLKWTYCDLTKQYFVSMRKIPFLNADKVGSAHQNTIIIAQQFRLKQNAQDRFKREDWILLKEYA